MAVQKFLFPSKNVPKTCFVFFCIKWCLTAKKVWRSKWRFWRWLGSCRQLICRHIVNRPFPSCPEPLFQSEAFVRSQWSEMIFYSRENKPLVINKGFALTLVFLELKKSTFFRIILRHTWPRDRTDIFGGKSACFEDEKKGFARFWRV